MWLIVYIGTFIVQVMHQTVREFFLRHNGYVTNSKFKMSEKEAHASICITLVRYLKLCVTNSIMARKTPDIMDWTSSHFERCAQYLNERPLLNYALERLQDHIYGCTQASNIAGLISQFVEDLEGSPAAYLLESWVIEDLHKTIPGPNLGDTARNFRSRLLHVAAKMRFSVAVEVLLIAGAQIESRRYNKTPLAVSVGNGDESTARVLLDYGASLLSRRRGSPTLLHVAAENGHQPVARLLLEHNVDADARWGYGGQFALQLAAGNGHESVVRLLIEYKVDINVKLGRGQTALHLAAGNGHESVVQLLLEHNAIVDAKDDNNEQTALHWAAGNGHESIVGLLLNHGADVNAQYRYGQTALHLAAGNGHEAVVQVLLDHGADIQAKIGCGERTAVHLAATNRRQRVVRLLQSTIYSRRMIAIADCIPHLSS